MNDEVKKQSRYTSEFKESAVKLTAESDQYRRQDKTVLLVN